MSESGDFGFADVGVARVDTDRERRQGLPEVVYGQGKTVSEIAVVMRRLLDGNHGPVLVTRVEPQAAATLAAEVPGGRYDGSARLLVWRPAPAAAFRLGVITAGTTDGPVAREAAAVAGAIGLQVWIIGDVGVAGLHRRLAVAEEIGAPGITVVNIDSGFGAAMAAHRLARSLRRSR